MTTSILDFMPRRCTIESLRQAAEKVGFVIPNPRRLLVRDLLFARKPKKTDSSPRSKTERGSE
jgi:hypothetical protein